MKPGIIKIVIAVLLFLLGSFLIPTGFVVYFVFTDEDPQGFLVPGQHTVQVEAPGRYYLWNDYRTVFEGTTYNSQEPLPAGLQFTVEDPQQNPLPFTSSANLSVTVNEHERVSIGYVDAPQPGPYTIQVTGNTAPRVFSFGPSTMGNMLVTIVVAFAVSIGSGILALGLLIWGIIQIASAKKTALLPVSQ